MCDVLMNYECGRFFYLAQTLADEFHMLETAENNFTNLILCASTARVMKRNEIRMESGGHEGVTLIIKSADYLATHVSNSKTEFR